VPSEWEDDEDGEDSAEDIVAREAGRTVMVKGQYSESRGRLVSRLVYLSVRSERARATPIVYEPSLNAASSRPT
jgi:hypothetical protein